MPRTVTIFNTRTREKATMFAGQAKEALRNHPDEWTDQPIEGAHDNRALAPTIEPGTGEPLASGERKRKRKAAPAANVETRKITVEPGSGGAGGASAPSDLQFDPGDHEPDDLTKISGIGPTLAKRLNAIGIVSYAQIAALSDDEMERIDEHFGPMSSAVRKNWRGQAATLAAAPAVPTNSA